jgi:hypothetical protein
VAETTNEGLTYIALLREGEGNERAVSFESTTGEEARVGDEIAVDGTEWQVVAIEPEEPPWAGVLVCERSVAGVNRSKRPLRLDDELPLPAEEPPLQEDDLPLHLRVLRALLEGKPEQERIDHALALANEVYELEANAEFED